MTSLTLRLGAAWYPEHGGESDIHRDLDLMRELGINSVRVGEFAWSCFEPADGQFETDWMRRCMDLAADGGIGVVLCTPTAAAPPWLFEQYPDLGWVTREGYRHRGGGRQEADYCNPDFQRHCRAIVEVIARDLGRHPALIAWQTDNELQGHQKVSLSASALALWHAWLEAQYGTIDALNEAWCSVVWSNRYDRFDQVPGPYPLPCYAHNHSLHTQYRRFMNDVILDFQRQQIEILRRHSDAPITHNSEDSLDEWDLTRDLDFASHDCYTRNRPLPDLVYRTDIFRSLKPGRRYWVMETDSEGSLDDGLFPPGWMANFAMLSYCAGGEGLSYWPWRQNRGGSEVIGHSFLAYATGQKASGWEEAVKVSALRAQLEPILAEFAPDRPSVACVRAERNGHMYYAERIAGLKPNFDYHAHVETWHHDLQRLGVWRDVVHDQGDFAGYKLVFAPYVSHTTPHLLEQMRASLAGGAVWVLGPYTGYLTEHHTNPTNALLGDLEETLGFRTKHWVPLTHPLGMTFADGRRTESLMYGHVFEPGDGDEVLGTYEGPRLGGGAWGIRRQVGAGAIYVLGSELADEGRRSLMAEILRREGIATYPLPTRVVRMPQASDDGRTAWALVNAETTPQTIALPAAGTDLLTGQRLTAAIDMPPNTNAFVVFDTPVQP